MSTGPQCGDESGEAEHEECVETVGGREGTQTQSHGDTTSVGETEDKTGTASSGCV